MYFLLKILQVWVSYARTFCSGSMTTKYVLRKPWRWLTISKDMMINEQIRAREVRLVGANGDQLGIKSRNDALDLAANLNLDLVLVAPNAKPPVCRIMDYGKFRFRMKEFKSKNDEHASFRERRQG